MDYKGTTNANPVNDIQQNIKPDRMKDNIFLKPKDTSNVWRAGGCTVWRLIQGAKAILKRRIDGGKTGTTWGRYSRVKKCKNEALKEAYEEL